MAEIEVPELLLCPISLEIMKDPVTTVTGITYDRESIEEWLQQKSNKKDCMCPVTKQPLPTDSHFLTPNHTLRRFIQAWCSANESNGVDRIPTPRSPLDNSQLHKLLTDLDAPRTFQTSLNKMHDLATQSQRNRNFMAQQRVPKAMVQFITTTFKQGGRFPGVSASSMRARFKMKNFEGSSSNAEKVEGEVEVNQPAQKKKGIVFKKRKSEVINLEEGEKAVPLSELSNFTVKQEKLHSFEEEGDGSSVWDKKFPFNVLADEIVQSAPDVARIEEVGDVGIDQFMQVLGFRLVSIGRSQEKRHKMMLGNSLEIIELKEQLKSKEIVLTELKEELSVSKEKLKLVKEDHERAVESLGKKVNELSTMSDQIIEVTAKLKHMESNHEAEILDAFAEGFERAVIQAKFLHPEEDFTALDPSKVVRDGQLVDDEEVVEEEGNNNLAD